MLTRDRRSDQRQAQPKSGHQGSWSPTRAPAQAIVFLGAASWQAVVIVMGGVSVGSGCRPQVSHEQIPSQIWRSKHEVGSTCGDAQSSSSGGFDDPEISSESSEV